MLNKLLFFTKRSYEDKKPTIIAWMKIWNLTYSLCLLLFIIWLCSLLQHRTTWSDFSIIFYPFFVNLSSNLNEETSPLTGIFSLFVYIIGYYSAFYIKEKKKWIGNILLTLLTIGWAGWYYLCILGLAAISAG